MYKIEILERGPVVVFSKSFDIPNADYKITTEDQLIDYIKRLDLKWYIKDAYLAQLYYTLHQWYPNHFYWITKI